MILYSVLGRPVFLNRRQENALLFADKISKELAAERRLKEENALQEHLHSMEEHSRENLNPTVRKLRAEAHRKYLASCTIKHHAYEYKEFSFYYEGKEYLYNNGDISDPSEIEEIIL